MCYNVCSQWECLFCRNSKCQYLNAWQIAVCWNLTQCNLVQLYGVLRGQIYIDDGGRSTSQDGIRHGTSEHIPYLWFTFGRKALNPDFLLNQVYCAIYCTFSALRQPVVCCLRLWVCHFDLSTSCNSRYYVTSSWIKSTDLLNKEGRN